MTVLLLFLVFGIGFVVGYLSKAAVQYAGEEDDL